MALQAPVRGSVDDGPSLDPNRMTVDLDAIAHNVRRLRERFGGPEAITFIAALKANAYGFGLLPVSETVLAAGVDALALVRLDDAIALRRAGVRVPILLYGGVRPDPRVIDAIVAHELTITVVDERDLDAWAVAATPIRAMVKVDVGLERLGAAPENAARLARRVADTRGLQLAGVYTHVHVPAATVEAVNPYLTWQFERFQGVLSELRDAGVDVPLAIAASSGAIRLSDALTLNGIDVGSLLFGLDTPGPTDRDLGLRPALVSLTSRLTQVRDVEREAYADLSPIPTGRPVRLGVIPMGASDGLLGLSAGHVLVGGRRAPVLAISLEHSRLDLTGIDAAAGDEVVVIGRQGDEEITVRDVAIANRLHSPAVVPVLVDPGVGRRYLRGEAASRD